MTQRQAEILQETGRFIAKVGAPTAILLIMLFMFWKAAHSLHESVVIPVVSAHTEFIHATQLTQARQAATLEAMAAGRQQQTEILHEIAEGQREIQEAINRGGQGEAKP